MNVSPRKLNAFLLFKLPAAYFCGVRTRSISETTCVVSVKHRWINQNPFNSMFWAVQGMAAELSTGALVMSKVKRSGKNISMLLTHIDSEFNKKAIERIEFSCNQGQIIDDAIAKAIETGEGQTILLNSKGINKEGFQVSDFNFEWSIKVKQ